MKKRNRVLLLMLVLGLQLPQPSSWAQAAEQKTRQPVGSSRKTGGTVKKPSATSSSQTKTSRAEAAKRRAARSRALARRNARLDAAVKKASREATLRDDLRGEDTEVRQAVLEALNDHAGAVVVMDPNSGRVYSIVNQDWVLRKGFKPCSTIKLVVSLAGLKEGVIDPSAPVLVGRRLPPLNLTEALAESNNRYFDLVGAQLGREKILKYARDFGLGSRTEINLPREIAGKIPSEKVPAAKKNPRGSRSLTASKVGLMASHGDGFEITALQLAVLTSAIVNGGYLYQPQVVRSEAEAKDFRPILTRQLDLSDEHRTNVISGMIAAVEFGTAKAAYDPSIQMAGKTGSCRGDTLTLGLFTSFATVQKPRMVVTIITNGFGERGTIASQIAGRIYQRLAHRLVDRMPTEAWGSTRAESQPGIQMLRSTVQSVAWVVSLMLKFLGFDPPMLYSSNEIPPDDLVTSELQRNRPCAASALQAMKIRVLIPQSTIRNLHFQKSLPLSKSDEGCCH